MTAAGWTLAAIPVALFLYAYLAYPAGLWSLAAIRPRRPPAEEGEGGQAPPGGWPAVTVLVPAHNEEGVIRRKLEDLLALDYPEDRRHVLVVSDASTDATDDIVREYAGRGVELVRLEERGGKTAAENAAVPHVETGIVVGTDATVRIPPPSLKRLVRAFDDPAVGAAGGRDVSVGGDEADANVGEAGYVGYEMWVRSLETRLGSVVGVGGCFYGVRADVFRQPVPPQLSRDFATALLARRAGYRAVSVDGAVAFVPRTDDLRAEYRRKARTMARGLRTLWHYRELLNPLRHGGFALMLLSHKLCRWLVPLTAPLAAVGLALAAPASPAAAALLAAGGGAAALGAGAAAAWPEDRGMPAPLAACAFGVASGAAALAAWGRALLGRDQAVWEPTRRPAARRS